MAFLFLLTFTLLNLAFPGSHGALPEEVYWKSVFPHTTMPKAMRDLLPTSGGESTKEVPTKQSETANDAPDSMMFYDYIDGDSASKESKCVKESKSVNDAPDSMWFYDYGDSDNKESKGIKESKSINDASDSMWFYDYDGGDSGNKGFMRVKEPKSINDAPASGNKNSLDGKHHMTLNSNPSSKKPEVDIATMDETIYFFEKDIHPGKMVKLNRLIKTKDMRSSTKFLPYGVGESIPFSSNRFPEILKRLSLKAESKVANTMKGTIKGCERATNGEEKYCATTFKSFIDLSVSKIGKNTQLISIEVGKEMNSPLFTIANGVQNMGEDEIVCHKMDYPYAVFLCHSIKQTVVYKVPLLGVDGKTKANGLAVCHKDTSAWSPNHAAFRILKVKPGTVPICHFLSRDTLVWVRKL
ncbi:hypothetical protein DITRI_Ditri14bG0019000 [Diplodiscus trichospermus]